MIRKFLFQLHLWTGLILGLIFVLIGLSGSISVLQPLFLAPPAVQVTAASVPALDKGLAAARAAVGAPQWGNYTINPPGGSHDPVYINFDQQKPVVITDPGTGRVVTTYWPKQFGGWLREWWQAIRTFHSDLFTRYGAAVEGWLGLVMVFLGLTGLYLWWPKAGQWKYGFIVRRKARGLRFHRELHGAAGIWTLIIYLVVTGTGAAFEFPQAFLTAITFVTGEKVPDFVTPIVIAPTGAVPIGPDAAFAAASKAYDDPIEYLQMPGWKPGQQTLPAIRAGTDSGPPIFIDPFHGTVIKQPPINNAYRVEMAMFYLHTAIGMGPVWTVLVFISGLMPLIFFVTGLMMWLKKRQNRLVMSQPLPEGLLEQQAP